MKPKKPKKISQKQMVLNTFAMAAGEWVPSHQIIKVQTEWGYIGTSGDRRAREMAELDPETGENLHVIFMAGRPYVVEKKETKVCEIFRFVPKPEQQQLTTTI